MEAFIKVYIKSEDDLPNKAGDYDTNFGKWSFEPWSDDDNSVWLAGVQWYYKPVEIPEIDNDTFLALPLDVPSDEEIEKKAMNHNRTDNYTTIDYYSTGIIVGSKWVRDEILKRNK